MPGVAGLARTINLDSRRAMEPLTKAVPRAVAHFCREAAIARAVLWEARHGFKAADPAVWEPILDQIREVDDHDARLRAEMAGHRRLEKQAPPEELSA
jgi:hypothetical protein